MDALKRQNKEETKDYSYFSHNRVTSRQCKALLQNDYYFKYIIVGQNAYIYCIYIYYFYPKFDVNDWSFCWI